MTAFYVNDLCLLNLVTCRPTVLDQTISVFQKIVMLSRNRSDLILRTVKVYPCYKLLQACSDDSNVFACKVYMRVGAG